MIETPAELLCIGNALVDVFAEVADGEDTALGLERQVQHIENAEMMNILGKLPAWSALTRSSGGGAANTAKIAGILGVSAAFVGAAGADSWGDFFESSLRAAGVAVTLVRGKEPTGIFLKLEIPGAPPKIACAPRGAWELAAEHIPEEAVRKAAVVMVDGYLLQRTGLVRFLLEMAHKSGAYAAMDLGSAEIAEEKAYEIAAYARLYELILFMNEEEAEAFFRVMSHQSENDNSSQQKKNALSDDAADFFRAFTSGDFFPVIVIKLGEAGSMVFAGGMVYRAGTRPAPVLDSTGAGDAFCAGFLAAWLRKRSLRNCAVFGNKTARQALAVHGTEVQAKDFAHLAKELDRNVTFITQKYAKGIDKNL